MVYLIGAAAVFLVYYIRRYWMSPWATYISHSETRRNGVFLTVRHVAWYPPFLSYDETYHQAHREDYNTRTINWSNSRTGTIPLGCPKYSYDDQSCHQRQLSCMLKSAQARSAEIEEILGGVR